MVGLAVEARHEQTVHGRNGDTADSRRLVLAAFRDAIASGGAEAKKHIIRALFVVSVFAEKAAALFMPPPWPSSRL